MTRGSRAARDDLASASLSIDPALIILLLFQMSDKMASCTLGNESAAGFRSYNPQDIAGLPSF